MNFEHLSSSFFKGFVLFNVQCFIDNFCLFVLFHFNHCNFCHSIYFWLPLSCIFKSFINLIYIKYSWYDRYNVLLLCVLCDHYCLSASIINVAMKQQQWIKHKLVDPGTFLLVKCVSRNKYISLWNDNTSCLYSLNSIKICKTIKIILYNFDKVSFVDLRLHVILLYLQSYFLNTCT